MRNYFEFKGYRTRIGYDDVQGTFVYLKVPEDDFNGSGGKQKSPEPARSTETALKVGAVGEGDAF